MDKKFKLGYVESLVAFELTHWDDKPVPMDDALVKKLHGCGGTTSHAKGWRVRSTDRLQSIVEVELNEIPYPEDINEIRDAILRELMPEPYRVPVIYELNQDGETAGVHFFCCVDCRDNGDVRKEIDGRRLDTGYSMLPSNDLQCEKCGTELKEP